jgi:hypothetical protein
MELYLLMVLHPRGHLITFVLVIGCVISVLDAIDVKSLCLFCVIVISGAKQLDRQDIVDQTMDLGYVEVVAKPKVDENVLIVMEVSKRFVHACKGKWGM